MSPLAGRLQATGPSRALKNSAKVLRGPQDERVLDSAHGEALEPFGCLDRFFSTLLDASLAGVMMVPVDKASPVESTTQAS